MTHITSGLVNRKYKAAAVAPVAANVMMPIRGISCNARFQGRCYLRILHPAHPKSLLNVKNEHKNLPPSSSSTFAKIQPSLIFTIFEKKKNSISTKWAWNSAPEDEGSASGMQLRVTGVTC